MELLRVSDENSARVLFDYWRQTVQHVPYYFETPFVTWNQCLFGDSDAQGPLFVDNHVYMAVDDDAVAGFVQYGKPTFHYDFKGHRFLNPDIGVIRQLYFRRDRPDVGAALLAHAELYCGDYEEVYAFYHAFGMGCQAYHGKLYDGMTHVEHLLKTHGFAVRHENVYYVLPLTRWRTIAHDAGDARVDSMDVEDVHQFSLYVGGRLAGTATLRYVSQLTDGATTNAAYLSWIGIAGELRQTGLGTRLMDHIVKHIGEQGCAYLHTDTALNNVGAQRFYERLGFINKGITRDYVRHGTAPGLDHGR